MTTEKVLLEHLARIAEELGRIADTLEKCNRVIGRGERGRDFIRTIDIGRNE